MVFFYRGLRIVIKYALFYLLGWLIHTIIVAGTFAALEKYNPAFLSRRKSLLEFWVTAVAAVLSVAMPVGFVWVKDGYIHIGMVLVICIVTLIMDYLRLFQKAVEPGPVRGDTVGYGLSLLVWCGLYAFG